MCLVTEIQICKQCGEPFERPVGRPGRPRLHCSSKCRVTWMLTHDPEGRREMKRRYDRTPNGRLRQKLAKKRRHKAHPERERARRRRRRQRRAAGRMVIRECENCGTAFEFDHQNRAKPRRACSVFCSAMLRKMLSRQPMHVYAAKECTRCGSEIPTKIGHFPLPDKCSRCRNWRLRQSPIWRASLKRWQEKNPNKVRAYNHRERARRRGAKKTGLVVPAEIFDRDGWRCQFCRCKVKKPTSRGGLKEATIDHIIPLSRGGSHTEANVQAACRMCNSKKNNKLIGQFRLF